MTTTLPKTKADGLAQLLAACMMPHQSAGQPGIRQVPGMRFTAFDGSEAGPPGALFGFHLMSERGARYLFTAPGELGLARAYVSGELRLSGVHEGDPYEALKLLAEGLDFHPPSARELVKTVAALGPRALAPITPPPQEARPRWRRVAEGLRHSKARDAGAIHHHYDVSNAFYEYVLGPSMTYTCACYPVAEADLEAAQEHKYQLVFEKLGLKPGDRLLDVGCGWGGMVRHAARRGVRALGVTLSAQQAAWAQQAIEREGLGDFAEVRHCDYRDVAEEDFDAVSSIGLTEHIGVGNYPAYFAFLRDRLKTGGLLLNHCITRPDSKLMNRAGSFIDRYVFPDAELASSGRIIVEIQDVGLEVCHSENLREHYAMTLRDWCRNLAAHWDEAVAEVGEGTARVWGIYLAGSRLGFERNNIQLHQVLAVKTDERGEAGLPLRPWWQP